MCGLTILALSPSLSSAFLLSLHPSLPLSSPPPSLPPSPFTLSVPPSLPFSPSLSLYLPPSVLTPLAYILLRIIPISVVLGVFFYLAYSSLSSVQLTKRIKLLFTPPKHHPDIFYVRKVGKERRPEELLCIPQLWFVSCM